MTSLGKNVPNISAFENLEDDLIVLRENLHLKWKSHCSPHPENTYCQ